MVSKKLDHMSIYLNAKEKNDDKFAKEKSDWELKDNFIERVYVRTLLNEIDKAVDEEGRCYVHLDDRHMRFTDKFEQGVQISIRIPTVDEEEAEAIRGRIQKVFHKPAMRDINNYDGSISYQFEKTYERVVNNDDEVVQVPGLIKVYINNASLADACEVIEIEETIKRYEIKCPDGMEVIDG